MAIGGGDMGGAEHGGAGTASNGPSRVELFVRAARTGLFGTLFVIQRKIHPATARSIVGSLIRFVQMVAFVFNRSAFPAWRSSTIAAGASERRDACRPGAQPPRDNVPPPPSAASRASHGAP